MSESDNKQSELWNAIINKAPLEEIKSLIDSGADLKETNSDGLNILAYAVMKHNDPEVIKLLVSKGLSIQQVDDKGRTLAHFAAENPNPQIMQTLIDYNVYFKKEDNDKNTPLLIAAMKGSPEVCELLLKKGSKLTSKDSMGRSSISLSVLNPNKEVFKFFTEYVSKNNILKKYKNEIFKCAIINNNIEIIKQIFPLIKENLNNYEKYKDECCSILAGCSDLRIIEFFSENVFDFSRPTSEGNFCYLVLAKNPNPDVIDYLIKNKLFFYNVDLIFSSIINNPSISVWKKALERVIDKNARDSNGCTLLMKYVLDTPTPNYDIIDLLADKTMINIKDCLGMNVCHFAVARNNLDILKYLKNKGANINERSNNGITPLMTSWFNVPNIKIIDYFIENGADIKERDSLGKDALLYSMKNIDLSIIKRLIDLGADIHTKNNDGENILMVALRSGADIEKIKYIISLGIDVNERDNKGIPTTFYAAGYNPYLEVLQFLIDKGVDINFETEKKENLLFFAAKNINPQIIAFLLSKGFDLRIANSDGVTPILEAARNSNIAVIDYLLFYNINGNGWGFTDKEGKNLMHYSCKYLSTIFWDWHGCYYTHLLLDNFDVNSRDSLGNTPILYASQNHSKVNIEIIKYLFRYGADIKAVNNNGDNILMMALKAENDLVLLTYLLNLNYIDLNAKNSQGETALMLAAKHYTNPILVDTLLKFGADVNAKDNNGKTAYQIAKEYNTNPAIAEIINKYMNMGLFTYKPSFEVIN